MTGYAFIARPSGRRYYSVVRGGSEQYDNTRPITAPPIGVCEADGATCPHTGQTIVERQSHPLYIGPPSPKITTPAGATSPDYKSDWGLSDWREQQRPAG